MSLSDKESSTSESGSIKCSVNVDGGARAWASLSGGYANAFGVYQDVYTRSKLASTSQISWIGSTQLFLLFAIGFPAGKLLDLGYYRHTMFFGTVLYVFSLFMVSIAHHDQYYQVFLSQAIGMGIGAGLLYVPALAIQAHYWQKRRAIAMGIVLLGSSTGGVIFPIMLDQLFKGAVGFEWGVRISAFVCLGLLTISNVIMMPNPDIAGLEKSKPDIKAVLTDVPYIILTVGSGLIETGLYFPYFYLQLFSIVKGIEPNIAFYTLAILNAASFPGRIVPNLFADRLGPINLFVPSAIICSGLLFSMYGISSVGSIVAFAIIYGFFSGAWIGLASPCLASLARHPNEVGVRFGFSFALAGIGALVGTPVIGVLLGNTFPWHKAILFSGGTTMAGSFFQFIARQQVSSRTGSKFV
ncbi:MFS general substrate transporter [Cyathus striatus]|nr:MFS general substrate transporter [Cyathus striatus]